jgi:S1-C subfamily serine protease
MKVTDVLTHNLALKVTDVLTHPGNRCPDIWQVRLVSQLVMATVRVECTRKDGSVCFGTGFIVGDGTAAVTAYHVIKDALKIKLVREPDEMKVTG